MTTLLAPSKFPVYLPLLGVPQLVFGPPSLTPGVVLDGCRGSNGEAMTHGAPLYLPPTPRPALYFPCPKHTLTPPLCLAHCEDIPQPATWLDLAWPLPP